MTLLPDVEQIIDTYGSVIALSKLYELNDQRISQTMVKGTLIIREDDGRIKTRSRAKQSKTPNAE